MTDKEKIHKAVKIAWQYAQYDGSHHKMWVIDQMVRALLEKLNIKILLMLIKHQTEKIIVRGIWELHHRTCILFAKCGKETYENRLYCR